LIDGHPMLPPGAEPWLRSINAYLRPRLTTSGERVEEADEPVHRAKRGPGVRHLGVGL
jgi:hypothetical protein